MSDTSTTSGDNPTDSDITAGDTTTTDPKTETDSQPGSDTNDLDDTSKSTDSSADDDKSEDEDNKSDDAPASPKLDEDLDDWVEKKGLPKAETDEQKAAYQAQRDEQREFTRTRQAEKAANDAKELGNEVHKAKPEASDDEDDDLDPIEKRQNALEQKYENERTTRLQSEFYAANSVTPEQHQAILEVFKEKVARPETPEAKQRAFDIWASPDALPDLLDLAKARLAKGSDDGTVADEAARKERERIARESQASSPGRGARSSTSTEKTEDQKRLDRFSNWD